MVPALKEGYYCDHITGKIKKAGPTQTLPFPEALLRSCYSRRLPENERFFARSRKAKILTVRIY